MRKAAHHEGVVPKAFPTAESVNEARNTIAEQCRCVAAGEEPDGTIEQQQRG